MLTNFINIDSFKYYIEFDNSYNYANEHRAQYIMLRNFTLMNEVIADNNLYFIEANLYKQLKEQIQNKESIDCLCFPSSSSRNHYSDYYTAFNDILTDDDFLYNFSAYEMLDADTLTSKYIKQNLIKIYHPHVKTANNYIVHVENIINNITVHYICNLYSNFNINSETEIRKQNNIYSEYIEVVIPDIRDLFGANYFDDEVTYSTYYKEDLNIISVISKESQEFIEHILKFNENMTEQYAPVALLTQPFLLTKNEDDHYQKTYFKYNLSVSNNYLLAPIIVTLFPYDSLDTVNHIYNLSTSLHVGSCSLYHDYHFKLSSVCDFDANGNISLLTQFIYPNKEVFEQSDKPEEGLAKAYCYFNGITDVDQYNNTYDKLYQTYQEELDEINCLTTVPDYDKEIMISQNSKCRTMNDTQLLAEYKKMKMDSFLEEYIDEYKTDIDFFGFRIEIGTDVNFKNIIFTQNQSLSINFLKSQLSADDEKKVKWDDCLNVHIFSFNINGLLENWTQVTDTLIAKVYFIDRFIGFVIESNPIVITKEKVKYIINNYEINRSLKLTEDNNAMTEYILSDNSTQSKFNFINNLHCIVHNDTERNDAIIDTIKSILNTEFDSYEHQLDAIQSVINGKTTASKSVASNQINNIIYKPIFFSTHTADNVRLVQCITQNIGIDLHEYVSMVNLFVLNLNGQQYNEVGRNTNYVIFTINALQLTETSGTYYIYDDENNYITNGKWQVIK